MKHSKIVILFALLLSLTACGQVGSSMDADSDIKQSEVSADEETSDNTESEIETDSEEESETEEITGSVFFGNYPQNMESAEPIEWIVLDSVKAGSIKDSASEMSEASVINASAIWDKYDKDPDKFTATYDGEMETVTGVVIYIGQDSHGTPSMEFSDTADGTSYVLGVFGSYDEMSSVSVGDTVTITGSFHIMSSESMVVLKRCEIQAIVLNMCSCFSVLFLSVTAAPAHPVTLRLSRLSQQSVGFLSLRDGSCNKMCLPPSCARTAHP